MVGTVTASDADAADELGSWQIKGGSGADIFDIRSRTGEIRIANASGIDFRKATQYTLTVIAGDGNLASHDEVVTIDIPDKVNVCHKDGKTLYVAKQSVPGHLHHGDSIGGCMK